MSAPCALPPHHTGELMTDPLAVLFNDYTIVGFLSFVGLLLKWFQPFWPSLRRERTGKQFARDCARQLIGSAWANKINMLMSKARKGEGQDECEVYIAQNLIACTVGTMLVFMIFSTLLSLLECTPALKKLSAKLVMSARSTPDGEIGELSERLISFQQRKGLSGQDDKVPILVFLMQIVFWLFVITLAKSLAVPIVLYVYPFLHRSLDTDVFHNEFVAVVVLPTMFDMLQYWLQDEILAHDWTRRDELAGHDLLDLAEKEEQSLEKANTELKKARNELKSKILENEKAIMGERLKHAGLSLELTHQDVMAQMIPCDDTAQLKQIGRDKEFAEDAKVHFELMLKNSKGLESGINDKLKQIYGILKEPEKPKPLPPPKGCCDDISHRCDIQ